MRKTVEQGKSAVHTTEGSDSFNYGVAWLMAILLLAAAGGAVWMMRSRLVVDWNSPDFNPLLVIPLALALIGLWNLQKAVRGSLRGRKFGASTLEMEREDVRLGEQLKGAIRTASTLKPAGDWQLTLRCIEQIEERELSNPTKSRTTDHVRWEARRRIDPSTVDSAKGIPFAFDVPTVALANGDARAKGAVRWTLEITAPMQGIDYYEIFGVIVRPQR